jgi:hypothetical protein
MTSREHASKPARRPNRTAKDRSLSNAADGAPVLETLQEAIDAERDNLSKAETLLGCLAISMEHGNWDHEDEVAQPYYPDVARMARDLVRQSINALDALNVQQHLQRRRIKDEAEPWGSDLRCVTAEAYGWWPLPQSHNSMRAVSAST